MHSILPVEKNRTTTPGQFIANVPVLRDKDFPHLFACTESAEKPACSIRILLLTRGFGRTLEYFCTFSAFSLA
jgi:hypothetical protein